MFPTRPRALLLLADRVFSECLDRRLQRPEVTVAVPAYNRGALIGDAIRGVLAQQRIAFELIVVDDGSDDDTAAVAASFGDPRIVVLRNPVNRGIAYCHNLNLARSRAARAAGGVLYRSVARALARWPAPRRLVAEERGGETAAAADGEALDPPLHLTDIDRRRVFDVVAEYQAADLFVLPCVEAANGGRDVTPNVLIEAMAMELPVVSSRQTAIPELVADGQCGILVEPGDVGALADAVARLAASEELRRCLGVRGRARVEELFDIDRNAVMLARLLVGEASGPAG